MSDVNRDSDLPVLFEKCIILLVFQFVQFIQILVLESVLMRLLLSLDQGLLD